MDKIILGIEKLWRGRIPEELYSNWKGKLEQRGYEVHPLGLISERGKDSPLADIRISEKYSKCRSIRVVLAREKETNNTQLSHLKGALHMDDIPYRKFGLD
ncbi:MAG TPA: hypothetical protein VMC80_01240 [Patescibacteria group bacterium]|nr:hypothetical protein [Patescibacteria group bacterium]